MSFRLPVTDEQWQEAVDVAHGLLAIESARRFGLIRGGPQCNVERCEEILTLGLERGTAPSQTAVEDTARAFKDAESEVE